MNSYKGVVFSNLIDSICRRRFLIIFIGSIAVAVLVGFIAVAYSEVAALLPLVFVLLMALPMQIYRYAIFINVWCDWHQSAKYEFASFYSRIVFDLAGSALESVISKMAWVFLGVRFYDGPRSAPRRHACG